MKDTCLERPHFMANCQLKTGSTVYRTDKNQGNARQNQSLALISVTLRKIIKYNLLLPPILNFSMEFAPWAQLWDEGIQIFWNQLIDWILKVRVVKVINELTFVSWLAQITILVTCVLAAYGFQFMWRTNFCINNKYAVNTWILVSSVYAIWHYLFNGLKLAQCKRGFVFHKLHYIHVLLYK